MDNKEKEKLRKWCERFFIDNQVGFDLFDFTAEIDMKLNLEENKTILRDKIKLFFNQYSQENIEKMKRKEAEVISKEQYEIITTEVKHKQEEQARLEFFKSLEKITESKDTFLLEQKFFLLREYVKMVCKGNTTGLIVEGETGLGKSFNVLKTIKESEREFVYCSGFTTALELYNFLYENRDKVIFFDDTKNIFKNEASLEILKASMFSPCEVRIVRYSSNTSKLRSPKEFIFNGGIIIALNDLKQYKEDMKAVVDRVLYYNVKFSYEEKLQVIADLIKADYKDLSIDNRKYIFEYIKKNTDEAVSNLNFRLLYKLYEIFRYAGSQEHFEKLAKHIIKKDEQVELILTLLKNNPTIKLAEQQFIEQGYGCRATFYNIKARLK